jgi:hypothetical protein
MTVTSSGRIDAPYLIVTQYPHTTRGIRWLWDTMQDDLNIRQTDCRVVCLLDEPPAGAHFRASAAQIKRCMPRFRKEMEVSAPKVVITLGADAFKCTTGLRVALEDARGYALKPEFWGKVLEPTRVESGIYANNNKAKGIKKGDPKYKNVRMEVAPPIPFGFSGRILPTYDMRQLQKTQFKLSQAVLWDLGKAKRSVEGTMIERAEGLEFYSEFTILRDLKGELKDDWSSEGSVDYTGPYLAFDIETLGIGSDVVARIALSDGKRTHTLAWDSLVAAWVQQQFQIPGCIYIGHNLMFDVPRLKMAGVTFPEGVSFFDTMLGAVQLQPDLPKGLGRVASLYVDCDPWKWDSLARADEEKYSALDAFIDYWVAMEQIECMQVEYA